MKLRIRRHPDAEGASAVIDHTTTPDVTTNNDGVADPSANIGDGTPAPDAGTTPDTQHNQEPDKNSDDGYMLTKLPKHDTPEYWEEFDKLPPEDAMKVESELNSLYANVDDKLKDLLDKRYAELDGAGEGDGGTTTDDTDDKGKPAADDGDIPEFKAITRDQFEKLDPEVQTTVKAMNKQLEDLSQYENEDFQKGLKTIQEDPVIKNRLEEIKNGDDDVEKYIQKGYNPNEHLTEEDYSDINFSDPKKVEESRKKLSNLLFQAAQKGAKIADANNNLKQVAYTRQVNNKVEIEKQLGTMISKNPSMKSDLGYDHGDHPLAPFFGWVNDNGINADQFAKLGVEHVFAMYQSNSGNLNKIIEDQVVKTKKQVFLDLEEADNTARNMSRNTQVDHSQSQGQMYKGIDLNRYKSDPGYRERMYDKADWETQQGLEVYVTSGEIPKKKPI